MKIRFRTTAAPSEADSRGVARGRQYLPSRRHSSLMIRTAMPDAVTSVTRHRRGFRYGS